jgi:hypothetical protein
MDFVWFFLLLVSSHILLMKLYRFTTYHAFFWPALPFLIGYASAVALAMYAIGLHEFLFWYIGLESYWLFTVWKKQSASPAVVAALSGGDEEASKLLEYSFALTFRYFAISSVVYMTTFFAAYVWLYNS